MHRNALDNDMANHFASGRCDGFRNIVCNFLRHFYHTERDKSDQVEQLAQSANKPVIRNTGGNPQIGHFHTPVTG